MTAVANQVRAAGTPVYCSACFNQDPRATHIDFDASCDRGYGTGVLPVAMDDLVICETCIKSAAGLLGMQEVDEDRVEELEKQNRYLLDRAKKSEAYADQLEGVLRERPVPLHIPKKRGRPVSALEED